MGKKLSVCVVTGSRADYSYLFYPMKLMQASSEIELSVVVTGSHLSDEHGNTIDAIKKDGISVTKEVPILLQGNNAKSVTKSMGKGVMEFADVLDDIKPDIVLVLGDRFEIMSVVQAALIAQIPVAHIAGGDVTEGAFDDALRHSITKMSHIHFVTNQQSYNRILQMGENPQNVYVTGSPSLDVINDTEFCAREEFIDSVGLSGDYEKYILLTYHPETLSGSCPEDDVKIVLDTMAEFKDLGIIITGANADTGGDGVNQILREYAKSNDNAVFHMSLGKERFYNALKHVDVFVGNSSSGLYEAPSFKLPVVNIGARQKNRLSADSVINCELNKDKIIDAIKEALDLSCDDVVNPYGDGNASKQIVEVLENIESPKELLQKHFFKYGEKYA